MLLTSERANSFVQFVTVLLLFFLVLALTYVTTRWVAGYQKSRLYSRNVEVVETFRLASNKYIQIVRTGDKYLVLALGKDTVTMLTELTEEEIRTEEEKTGKGFSFQDILEQVNMKKPKK